MELKKDICPYCGGTETITGKQFGQGSIVSEDALTVMFGTQLYHVVCRSCGTVIRSYVKDIDLLT